MLIDAVLPYLGTKDPVLRKELHRTLLWVDQVHGGRKDFSQFESYLKRAGGVPCEALIRYMFDSEPQAAVLSMARVYGDKSAESDVADKLKGDPKTVLQSVAGRPEWWAHMYAVETMRKNPQLRDPAILKQLERDEHPLVREALAEIKGGQPEPK
jgi:hypothetical protein